MDEPDAVPHAADLGGSHSEGKHHSSWMDYVSVAGLHAVCFYMIIAAAAMIIASNYSEFPLLQNLHILILTLTGAGLTASGSFTLNNYLDRDLDAVMERTKHRPAAAGRMKPVRILTAGLAEAALGIMILGAVEPVSAAAAAAGLIVYIVVYTLWMKRVSPLHPAAGSLAAAVTPLVGWAAVDPALHSHAWLLSCILFIWYPPHYLALTIRYREEFQAAGIPVLPVKAGQAAAKRQIVLYAAVLLAVSLFLREYGTVYTAAAVLLGAGWLIPGTAGLFMKTDTGWTGYMFVYSLSYMTILFIVMAAVHL
ncbi:heme o synthase [Salibacterium halotolerans]|uniref:Protoheme IX farnesyltransferase n=1 Tax=Salibacterium halotolerans TaxID=1884432 RepID=A0A1I5M164_9BACI|nr:heme o synthase [Salibacterium halotolerans]SFP03348.1 protoheme IX farnesyltransferase [Salibacterium halotolerans]